MKCRRNRRIEYWKATRKSMRYLHGTKNHILTYKHVCHLEVVGYSNTNFVYCQDSRKSFSGYVFMLDGRCYVMAGRAPNIL